MNILDLNLRHIHVFNVVAETLSMSKSAQLLYITQPAVSQTIKEIENKFGVKLFIRKGRSLFLTDEGKEFYVYTKRVVNLLKDAQLCLENFNTLNKGIVRIGASSTIGNYLLPELIKSFREKYANIDVSVYIGNTKQVLNKLTVCDVSVALIEGIPDVDDERIKVSKFVKDEIVFFCHPSHTLAGKKVKPGELEKAVFINREKGSGTRQVIEEKLKKYNIRLNVHYEFNNSEAIKNAVLSNLGISALSRLVVRREVENGLLKVISVEGVKIHRWFYLLQIGDHNKAQGIFVEHIFNSVKNYLPYSTLS